MQSYKVQALTSRTGVVTLKVDTESPAWRLFCGIEIPADTAQRIGRHIKKLQQEPFNASASWSRPENLHLTLKFLGNVQRDRVPEVSGAASAATRHIKPFTISIGGTGTFPKQGPPRVLWIGIDDPDRRLAELQTQLEDACAALGFSREERPFSPHLTIARLRKPQGAKELGRAHRELGFKPVEVTVSELIVIRSELGKDGSKYSAISRHQFGQ